MSTQIDTMFVHLPRTYALECTPLKNDQLPVKDINQPPVKRGSRERSPGLGEDRTMLIIPESTGNIEMASKESNIGSTGRGKSRCD